MLEYNNFIVCLFFTLVDKILLNKFVIISL